MLRHQGWAIWPGVGDMAKIFDPDIGHYLDNHIYDDIARVLVIQ